jgi:hypothetical protein
MKNRVTTPGLTAMNRKVQCKFCDKETTLGNIGRHETYCYLNPQNTKYCLVCNGVIKNYKSSKGTCSRSCANTHFKSGENNGNFKGDSYQYLCFTHHKKECVVCGENKIVAVHHLNEDHHDNRIENLVPLCPTHHQYMHSRYKVEIKPIVDAYIESFKLGLVQSG